MSETFNFPPVVTVFSAAYSLEHGRVVIEDQRTGDMWSEPRDGWTYHCPGDSPAGWHFRHEDGRIASVMKNPGPYATHMGLL
jgi:hypothetical protein